MKHLRFLLFALLSIMLLVACNDEANEEPSSESSETNTSEEASDEGSKDNNDASTNGNDQELVIAVNENFISMDPHNTGDTNSNSVQSSMLEGLLGFDSEGKVVNVLATDYSVSDDATEFTFKLREGVKFHDGEDFNSEAVKINFERIMNDESLRLYSRGFNLVSNIEIINDYEIKITLKEPYGPMITRFGVAKIMSPKFIQEEASEIPKKAVGTGPFKFVNWVQGDYLTVERFDGYWDGNDRVAKITNLFQKMVHV